MKEQLGAEEPRQIVHVIFDGGAGEISVALVSLGREHSHDRLMMALRWNEGDESIASWQEDVGWFLLPFTFAKAIGRSLIEMQAFDVPGIKEAGFAAMLSWLAEVDAVDSAMCY